MQYDHVIKQKHKVQVCNRKVSCQLIQFQLYQHCEYQIGKFETPYPNTLITRYLSYQAIDQAWSHHKHKKYIIHTACSQLRVPFLNLSGVN
jgi:hypothetical protein